LAVVRHCVGFERGIINQFASQGNAGWRTLPIPPVEGGHAGQKNVKIRHILGVIEVENILTWVGPKPV